MKKILKVSLIALSSLFALPLAYNATHSLHAEGENSTEVDPTIQANLEIAKEYLKINSDLNNVVSNLYLPTRGLFSTQITWASSDTKVVTNSGVVTRPAVGSQPVDVTLTATLSLTGVTTTKEFKLHVLPALEYTETVESKFEEDFNSYKVGLDISNYFRWELSAGDDIAKIRDSVKDNNKIGEDNVLDFEPLVTLYKDSIYRTKINISAKSVFETYIMSSGDKAGFYVELNNNSSNLISLGLVDGKFILQQKEQQQVGETTTTVTVNKEIGEYLDGVWYKLRLEIDPTTKKVKIYLYDYINNEIKNLTNSISTDGADFLFQQTSINYLRFRTSKGKSDLDSHVYISNILIDEATKVGEAQLDTNPNRTKGIGKIENFTSSYLLIQGETLNLEELKIYNRFKPTEVLAKDTDYEIKETYKDNKEVNTNTVGDYEKTITITLKETKEVKVLTQTFHVDDEEGTADLSTLRIAPIVDDLNTSYVDKKVSISANVDRKGAKVYYAALPAGSNALDAGGVKNASDQTIHGLITVDGASFSQEVQGLENNKEYDFYVVTENEKGTLSEVYKKENISVNVYNIETAEDFYFMCTDPDVQTTSFRLMNDIDFKDYYWEAKEITRPTYKGTFDGQGHKIMNLEIDAPFKKSSLFYEFAGTFKNLVMENCHLAGGNSIGFIGGYGKGGAVVSNIRMKNCHIDVSKEASSGDGYYGLIFGRCEETGGSSVSIDHVNIEDCSVTGDKYVGAMVGNLQNISELKITNTYCKASLTSDGAALGVVSRARTSLVIEDSYFDITVPFAKKEVAVIAGQVHSKVTLKNVLGKLKVISLTQPTYFNNFTGAYNSTASVEFENVYFFAPDTTSLSEDALTSDAKSRSIGHIIYSEPQNNKEWWEKNTCFKNLDTMSHWYYDETLNRPALREEVKTSFEFTAAEVNHYIDLIGDKITSASAYYIRKARELYQYVKESEKSQVHLDKLEEAEAKYQQYLEELNNSLGFVDDVYGSLTGGIEWGYEKKENN